MQVSARYLGQEYGLTAEETNRLLFKQGILTGKPGAYDVTPKGRPYVVTEYYHRGTGGYDHYNRYWLTRTYDENIKEILDFLLRILLKLKKKWLMLVLPGMLNEQWNELKLMRNSLLKTQ